MFKKLLFFLLISGFSFFNAQENPVDFISIPGPVELNATEFFLVNSKQFSKTYFRQQYLPADQKVDDFNELLDVSYFTKEIEMELAVRQKVESIQQRESKDKFAKVNVTESPDGKEYIVDYYISESPEKGSPYIEYNIYRFKTIETGSGKNFLILNYAKRMYGDLKSSAKSIAKQRDNLMGVIIEFKVPEIKITDKAVR